MLVCLFVCVCVCLYVSCVSVCACACVQTSDKAHYDFYRMDHLLYRSVDKSIINSTKSYLAHNDPVGFWRNVNAVLVSTGLQLLTLSPVAYRVA